jgi:hypothetical protein
MLGLMALEQIPELFDTYQFLGGMFRGFGIAKKAWKSTRFRETRAYGGLRSSGERGFMIAISLVGL